MAPRISVIVPNHNYGLFLDRFLGSLAAQAFPAREVEVWLVDDASTDDSLARAEAWRARSAWAGLEILRLPRTRWPGLVRNEGLRRARGELLLCCDPDDWLEPEFLSRTVAALDADPEKHLAFTDYWEDSPQGMRLMSLPEFRPAILRTQNICHTTTLLRREVWEASRGFRANTTYEDWDFWVQAAQNGFSAVHVAEPLLHYCLHKANFSHTAVKADGLSKAAIVRNNPRFFPPEVRAWAAAHIRREFWAPAFSRGVIPRAEDIRALLDLYAQRRGQAHAGAIAPAGQPRSSA